MIIGNGLLAEAFLKYNSDSIVFFASGVSNSNEISELKFNREKELLLKTINKIDKKLFIYFSSCYVDNVDMKYYHHKKNMEKIIQNNVSNYNIFRLPQVLGNGGNTNNLINFLFNSIKNGTEFKLFKNATRNLIDIEDVVKIVIFILHNNLFNNRIVNIASSKNISILNLVNLIENKLNKKAEYIIENIGEDIYIDVSDIEVLLNKLEIKFDDVYINSVLKKYY